jgi:hypothetical protein
MKTDIGTLILSMRKALRPTFLKLGSISGEEMSNALDMIERESLRMILEAGYTESEFYKEQREYFMDFSSDNPDEWVIRHDPENAAIISSK